MRNPVMFVVGARPNFVKVAPILRALATRGTFSHYLVHTGQHYDESLSRHFFRDLTIPEPDINLGVGSADHGAQTGEIMRRLEPIIKSVRPCCTVVVGDVNSTLAAALVAAKQHVPLAHVEAGLRSFDRTMPEEVNRVVTDVLSDLLFVTEPAGVANLLGEGVARDKIHLVGDVMVDAVVQHLQQARMAAEPLLAQLDSTPFGLLTLHRPSNVDDRDKLSRIVDRIGAVCRELPMVFPVHPRTSRRLRDFGLEENVRKTPGLHLLAPLGYLEFLGLLASSRLVVTDSGGIQAEATYLRTPCLTLRDTTERPGTVCSGANRLLGNAPEAILPAVRDVLSRNEPPPEPPALMDGRAAERIMSILVEQHFGKAR